MARRLFGIACPIVWKYTHNMTNSPYDFQGFLQRMARLSYIEILREADKECALVECTLSRVKNAPRNRDQGGVAYCSQIKEFLFFMQNFTRPGSASLANFQAYKPVVQSLISRGELSDGTLTLFA
jgi:hypothetical protein